MQTQRVNIDKYTTLCYDGCMATASAEAIKPKQSSEIQHNLEATKPLLFSMAEQILLTDKDRWNIIIGDDAGGRLPAHFVHDLLKQDGRNVKTFFVAASATYRKENGAEPYEQYFKYLEEQLGEPLRPLVVTESVQTGGTVDFLREHLAQVSSTTPEFAAVATSEIASQKIEFIGGVGDEALKDVWRAYESPVAKLSLGRRAVKAIWKALPGQAKVAIKSRTDAHINPPTMNDTIGLVVDTNSQTPIASRYEGRDGQAATDAYRLIDEFAAEAYESVVEKHSVPAA